MGAAMCAFIAESRHAAHASVMTEIEDRRSTTALVTVLDIVIGERRWERSEPDRSPASSINSTRATSRRHTRTADTADTNIRHLPLFYLRDNLIN